MSGVLIIVVAFEPILSAIRSTASFVSYNLIRMMAVSQVTGAWWLVTCHSHHHHHHFKIVHISFFFSSIWLGKKSILPPAYSTVTVVHNEKSPARKRRNIM